MGEMQIKGYGFVNREVSNVGTAPFKNVISKVVTQARLAEPFVVLQQQDGWYEVELSDTYRGWVSPAEVVLTSKEYWESYQAGPMVLVTAHFSYVYKNDCCDFSTDNKDNRHLLSGVTLATMLKLVAEEGNAYRVMLPDGTTGLLPKQDGRVIPAFNKIELGTGESIVNLAKEFLGLPYYWGGTTSYGYDCSGLMQTMYKMSGIHLLRDADQQYEQGVAIENRDELQMGDMVFFSTYKEGASHVGIYIADGQYIHSGSRGGIAINSFRKEDECYSEPLDEKYLGSRRVL